VKFTFRKMHGLGNDFVVLDARNRRDLHLTPAAAAALADRHTGIGCDQVIVLEPVEEAGGADVFMRIRNPDGSEAGACGNATRCVAQIVAAETNRPRVTVRTVSGDLPAEALPDGRWRVDMGPARLGWREVPLSHEVDTLHLPIARGPIGDPAACSMGNPHATFFLPDLPRLRIDTFGPSLERDPLFPEGANIGFVQVLAPDHLRLLVWERSAGATRACGSAACAALVNAHRRGCTGRRATVTLPGGDLLIEWREEDGHVLMTGPVATAFTGEVELDTLSAAP
jgi:diaminopimelate epimerase